MPTDPRVFVVEIGMPRVDPPYADPPRVQDPPPVRSDPPPPKSELSDYLGCAAWLAAFIAVVALIVAKVFFWER